MIPKFVEIRLWLDDIRPMPEDFDVHVRSASVAIEILDHFKVGKISFDHDLGGQQTGYDVAKFIEKGAQDGTIQSLEWHIHSANPPGAKNISAAMKKAEEFWKERGLL
jgi:hypothetical protein